MKPWRNQLNKKYKGRIIPEKISAFERDKNGKITKLIRPMDTNDIKEMINERPNIDLRSAVCTRAYKRYLKKEQKLQNKQDKSMKFIKANYPYMVKEKYKHYILWYHGTWSEFQGIYEEINNKRIKLYKDEFTWINKPEQRSQDIPHAHYILFNQKKF
jgi:hypothetical protein